MIAVIATLHCTEENEEHLVSALKTLQFHSRQEEGCQRYDLLQRKVGKQSELILSELWDNEDSLEAHFNAGHFNRFTAQAEDIVENTEIRKFDVLEE